MKSRSMSSTWRLLVILSALLPVLASAQQVVKWGNEYGTHYDVPDAVQGNTVAVACGTRSHYLAILSGGSVVAWGKNDSGQCNVPPAAQSDVVAVAAGAGISFALKSNGSVVAWGNNSVGQCNVPLAAQSGVVSIAAGNNGGYAIKANGTVVAWGYNWSGNTDTSGLTGIVAIAGGENYPVALGADGSVRNWQGGTSAPAEARSGVIAVAAGYRHFVALKSNGGVIVWGDNSYHQCDVPESAKSGVVAISAGGDFTVALKSDGSVVAWGLNAFGETAVPPTAASHVTSICSGGYATLAIRDEWIQCDPSTVWSGSSAVGSVHLKDPAPPGGLILQLSSSDPHVRVPAAISLNGGQSIARFHIATDLVLSPLHTAFVSFTEGDHQVAGALQIQSHKVTASFNQDQLIAGSNQAASLTIDLDAALAQNVKLVLSGSTGLNPPASATIPAGQIRVVVSWLPSATLPTGIATVNISYREEPAASAEVSVAPIIATLNLPGSAVKGSTYTAKVVLSPTNRVAYRAYLSSPNPEISFPASVKILAGAGEATFPVQVAPDANISTATIVVTLNGVARQGYLKIVNDDVIDMSFSPSTVKGGDTSTATVTLRAVSSVDLVVHLTSSAPITAPVPATVTVPKGSLTATFTIATNPTTTTKTAKINAYTIGGVTRNLTITP